jgi:hypothetical protein
MKARPMPLVRARVRLARASPDRFVPAFVVACAIWTMYVHLIIATHSSFVALLHGLPLVAVVAVAAAVGWFLLPGPVAAAGPGVSDARASLPVRENSGRVLPLAALALASIWVALLWAGMPYPVFFWIALLGAGGAWAWNLRGGSPAALGDIPEPSALQKHAGRVVILVAVAAVCVTLVASRPDPDDALHLSIPASLLRFPQQPVLLHDTLYRLPDAPILTPFYRLNSYDVLIGLLARITGVDLHVIAYLVLPALFAVFCVLAWVYLLRRIVPDRWPSVLLILFLVVVALGEAHRAYGNFAFVRLFQGKAILATGMVPVMAGAALSFVRSGGLRQWLLLFAAQAAAVGFAATALFVAPAAALLGLAGGWSADAKGSRRFVLGMLASAYVFAAARAVSSATHGGQGFVTANPMPDMLQLLDGAWGSWSTGVLLAALLAAWAFVRNPVRARYLSAGAFFFLLAVLNPHTCRFVADRFVGVYTYWRLTWALPLPFLLAVVFDGIAWRALRVRPKVLAAGACALLVGLAVTFGWRFGTLRADNGVTLGVPHIKVYPIEYRVARQLAEEVPEQAVALTPELVAFWLPTFVVHPQLLGVRLPYLTQSFAPPEAAMRRVLMLYVAGQERSPDAAMLFAKALEWGRLDAVVFAHSAPWRGEMEAILERQAFQPLASGPYDTWVRAGGPASLAANPGRRP